MYLNMNQIYYCFERKYELQILKVDSDT